MIPVHRLRMKIIGRYVIREIVRYFGIILLIVLGVYLTVDFIEKVDNFIEAALTWQRAFLFFICKIPLILVQLTPVGTLLAVMITFGLMAKNNELLALRIGGISMVSLLRPMVGCGLAAVVLMVIIAEAIMPFTVSQANQIWLQEVRGYKGARIRQSDIWLKSDESILNIKLFHPEKQMAEGITLHRFNPQFKLTERIDAEKGVFKDGGWTLHRGIIQQQVDRPGVRLFEDLRIPLGFTPEDLASARPKPEEMSFLQLYRFIAKVEAEGYDATRYRVDLQAKISFPFISLIMTIIGAGLAARGKVKGSLPGSITMGLGIAFLYWIVFSFCLSLGYAGALPSLIAAWGANLIFTCLAGYLMMTAD